MLHLKKEVLCASRYAGSTLWNRWFASCIWPIGVQQPICALQGAGFSSQMIQPVHQPVMTILLQPCWDFFFGFCVFVYKHLHKKIKSCNLSLEFCRLHWVFFQHQREDSDLRIIQNSFISNNDNCSHMCWQFYVWKWLIISNPHQ